MHPSGEEVFKGSEIWYKLPADITNIRDEFVDKVDPFDCLVMVLVLNHSWSSWFCVRVVRAVYEVNWTWVNVFNTDIVCNIIVNNEIINYYWEEFESTIYLFVT